MPEKETTKKTLGVKQAFQFAGILLLAMVIFHGPLMWTGQVLSGGDLVNNFIPMREKQLEHGWFSPWMEETFSGRPLAEEVQVGAFYPPNWLHLVVRPVERGFTFLTMAHLFFSGLGMYFFLRRRFGFAGAVLGGLLWVCSGYLPLRLINGVVVFIYAFAWLPWMWWAAEQQSLRGGLRWTGLLALFGGMQILAGSPQPVQITWIGLGFWTLGRLILPEEGEKRWAIAGGFVVAGVLALLMAVPYFAGILRFQGEAYPRAEEDLFRFLADGSLQPRVMITWIVPDYLGLTTSEHFYWASEVGFMETNTYMGVLPWMLALFCLISLPWKRFKAWAKDPQERVKVRWLITLLVMTVLSLAVALGDEFFLFEALTMYIPSFDLFRVPARWIVWCSMALIVLAAWGFDELERRCSETENRKALIRWVVGAGIVVVIFLVMRLFTEPLMEGMGLRRFLGIRFGPQHQEQREILIGYAKSASALAVGLALVSAVLGGLGLAGRLNGRLAMVFLALVLLIDLRIFWAAFDTPIPDDLPPQEVETEAFVHRISASRFREYYYPETGLVSFLRENADGRVHFSDALIAMQFDQFNREMINERPAMLGIDVTRGYQQIHLRSYIEDYRSSLPQYPSMKPADAFLAYEDITDRRFFDAYNVTHAITFPVAGMDEDYISVGLENRQQVGDFGCLAWENPHVRGWAWLSESDAFLDAEPSDSGRIDIEERSPSRWAGTVEVSDPCFLHLSSPDYSGWKLMVTSPDGDVVEGLNSRTVELTKPGTWTFERRFESVALKPLKLLIALGAMLAAIGMAISRRRKDEG